MSEGATDRPATDYYKTHVLIGVRGNAMEVIGSWPYLPQMSEVQRKIDTALDAWDICLLCNPTAILPGSKGSRMRMPTRPRR